MAVCSSPSSTSEEEGARSASKTAALRTEERRVAGSDLEKEWRCRIQGSIETVSPKSTTTCGMCCRIKLRLIAPSHGWKQTSHIAR